MANKEEKKETKKTIKANPSNTKAVSKISDKKTTKSSTTKTSSKKTTVKKDLGSTTKTTTNKNTKSNVKKDNIKDNQVENVKPDSIKKEDINLEIKSNVKNDNSTIGLFEKIIILIAVALVFLLLGYFIGGRGSKKNNRLIDDNLQTFVNEYNNILNNYYEDVNKELLIKGAINGMLSTLDDYSSIIDDSSNNFTITLEGEYEGLGIEVTTDLEGNIIIYSVFDNTPAKRADIRVNDIVTKINDINLEGKTTKELIDIISKSENIKLVLKRNDEELTKEVKKEKIVLDSVFSKMINDDIGYIKVSIFANNTKSQFEAALNNLEKNGMKSLIIDLRDNTGGHLSTVKDMLSLFLDNSHPIYKTETKEEIVEYYSTGKEDKKYKIVILQNIVSASASEIMASALSEQLSAYIIGTRSYGKGTVQQLETVSGIGQYKFTTKKWLTSKGEWIDKKGVTPDLEVEQSQEYINNPTDDVDLQLKEAIKYLER